MGDRCVLVVWFDRWHLSGADQPSPPGTAGAHADLAMDGGRLRSAVDRDDRHTGRRYGYIQLHTVEERRPTFESDRRLIAVAMAHQYEYVLGGIALLTIGMMTWRSKSRETRAGTGIRKPDSSEAEAHKQKKP